MGSLSLYRGNLHRVSNAPREWLMPPRRISLKDFKSLLRRRQEALNRIPRTTSNPNPNPNPNSSAEQQLLQPKHEFVGDNGCSKQKGPQILTTTKPPPPQPQATTSGDVAKETKVTVGRVERDRLQQHQRVVRCAKDQSGSDGDARGEKRKRSRDSLSSPDTKSVVPEVARVVNDCDHAVLGAAQDLKQVASVPGPPAPDAPVEITKNLELLSFKEKKKRDLQHDLEVLNARKHNLVQMLKQVLNTEEEMKRRISVKASGFATPLPQQMEVTTEFGSNPGQGNRGGQQADLCADMEEESEDIPNSNSHTRQFHGKPSTSPSASSPLRKVSQSPRQHTVGPLNNRQSSGVSGNGPQTSSSMPAGVASSPARFTVSGHQGHPSGHVAPLSVSGTHFTTPSPSPAGSGGTSVFRDARVTSPSWS